MLSTTGSASTEAIPAQRTSAGCLNSEFSAATQQAKGPPETSGSPCGGGGIRTPGTHRVQRFSRPPRSTTPAPLRRKPIKLLRLRSAGNERLPNSPRCTSGAASNHPGHGRMCRSNQIRQVRRIDACFQCVANDNEIGTGVDDSCNRLGGLDTSSD